MLADVDLRAALGSMCRVDSWPYSPGVSITNGQIQISDFNSTPPGGGRVHWRDVVITAAASPGGLPPPWPCAAAGVTHGTQLGGGAGGLLPGLLGSSTGAVFVSLARDLALPSDGSWSPVELPAGRLLVLLGDPDRSAAGSPTVLDLGGIAAAWTAPRRQLVLTGLSEDGSAVSVSPDSGIPGADKLYGSDPGLPVAAAPYAVAEYGVARLYDLLLVNLPPARRPAAEWALMAAAVNSFGVSWWEVGGGRGGWEAGRAAGMGWDELGWGGNAEPGWSTGFGVVNSCLPHVGNFGGRRSGEVRGSREQSGAVGEGGEVEAVGGAVRKRRCLGRGRPGPGGTRGLRLVDRHSPPWLCANPRSRSYISGLQHPPLLPIHACFSGQPHTRIAPPQGR